MKREINHLKNSTLKDFTKEQLIEIIDKTTNENKSFKQKIDEYANKKRADFEEVNNHSEYSILWNKSEKIISEFNEYGGGDEDDESIVYKNLDKIVEFFQQKKLDEKTKIEFINNCFEHYYCNNSGFEDLLRDSIFNVCDNKKDWLLVIEKLKRSSSNYDADQIIKIYRDKLGDDETYLRLRMANLHYGADYFDLVEYYHKKNELDKAVNIAKEGIEKDTGRIIDLIEFLLDIYTKNKDYENILKYRLLSFKENPSFEEYLKIREFCAKPDVDRVLDELRNIIRASKDEELKVKVDYFNGNYLTALKYVKSYLGNYYYDSKIKEWAIKLEPHFPKDLSNIYLDKIKHILEHKIAKEYSSAGYYLGRVKIIFLNIMHSKKEWDNLLHSLNQKSIKLPSFQKMLQGFEEKI